MNNYFIASGYDMHFYDDIQTEEEFKTPFFISQPPSGDHQPNGELIIAESIFPRCKTVNFDFYYDYIIYQ